MIPTLTSECGCRGDVVIVQCQCGATSPLSIHLKTAACDRCSKCGRDLRLRAGSSPLIVPGKYPNASRPGRLRGIAKLAVILALAGVVLYKAWHAGPRQPAAAAVPKATDPAESWRQAIIAEDAGRSGDPELTQAYQEINQQYFAGGLPRIPVLWEPKLGAPGELTAGGLTQEGLAADEEGKIFILLNPVVGSDQARLRRALCHEAVHVYLYARGDMTTNHGPAFQAVLQRLLAAGAFRAISATEDEKLRLKSWLDSESHRLDADRPSSNEDVLNWTRLAAK